MLLGIHLDAQRSFAHNVNCTPSVQGIRVPNIKEGKLAETPLRQAKNLFIGLVTMVGKFAAIPGGMDIEQTYQLIDTYIQECEKLQAEEAVKNLQYNMPIDFAKRVAQQKLPVGVSQEIYSCMQFISTHVNEPKPICRRDNHSHKCISSSLCLRQE